MKNEGYKYFFYDNNLAEITLFDLRFRTVAEKKLHTAVIFNFYTWWDCTHLGTSVRTNHTIFKNSQF